MYSIPMALVDFIPVVLYFLANRILQKDLKGKMSGVIFVIYSVGFYMVTLAGALKALYKLFSAANVGDFTWMSDQFFSNQSFGFLLAGVGLLVYVCSSKKRGQKLNGFIPVMGLVGIMVAGLGLIDGSLCALAVRTKKKSCIIFFILSFVFCMMMGYLSSRDFTQSYMNWAAEGINVLGQTMLYLGCRSLDKAGLKGI